MKKKFSVFLVFAFIAITCFGIINVQEVKAATIGQQLPQPEAGWKRYDNTDTSISYIGKNWTSQSGGGWYGGSERYGSIGDSYQFNFIGTKIRLIDCFNYNRSDNTLVYIDGKLVDKFSHATLAINVPQLIYEITGLEYKEHCVKVINSNINASTSIIALDAIDIDESGQLKSYNENPQISVSSISLNKTTGILKIGQVDNLIATIIPDNAVNKNITWTSSDPTIATVDQAGKVTAIKEGSAFITATTQDGTNLKATCNINVVTSSLILNVEPEKNKIKANETVSANIVIDNITEIAAEDITIKYDNTKLQFLGMEEVEGIKIVKSNTQEGELRIIVASKGANNIINAKKTLLKLNFKGISAGEALVDITKGRVSDGIAMEKSLEDSECGQGIIIIEDLKDVNNSGEFTLLDLAIDARHLGENPKSLPQYNTDIVGNNAIDNEDLLKIVEYMLQNPNYTP